MSHARCSETTAVLRGRFTYYLRAESGGGHTVTRRSTVSSAVSPVGPDLVIGSSVAERECVSPQRARFDGAVRVPRIASSVFALSLGGMSDDSEVRAAVRAR